MLRRLITLSLAVLLVVGMAACQPSTPSPSDSPAANTPAGSASTPPSTEPTENTTGDYPDYISAPGEFPITKERITLSAFAPSNNAGTDWSYGSNSFTTWLVDKTNIDFAFTVVNSVDAKEKLSLMMAGGDYPDIMFRTNFSLSEQQLYGSQGVLMPLNDLIETYTVNAKQMLVDFPLAKDTFTLNDGMMYDLPSVNECYHCSVTQKMWVYTPWLEALGMEKPTTTEEYHDLLVAIRDTDLNGNGKKDEIPLAGSPKGWDANLDGFLMQPFARTGSYVDNGTVSVDWVSEGWREGLAYLHQLYTEGLIAPESLTQDADQLKQLGSSLDHLLGTAPGGYHGTFTTIADDTDWKLWETIAPLKGPSGRQFSSYVPTGNFYSSFSITDKCAYPEAAIRLADAMLEEEATLRNTEGEKGVDWDYVTDSSVLGINGSPAVWIQTRNTGTFDPNHYWNQAGPTLRSNDLRLGQTATEDGYLEVALYNESKENYYPYIYTEESVFPKLPYSEADAVELAMFEEPINKFRDEMTAKFVTGEKSLETDWDAYVTEMDKIGLSKMLAIYQKALDAKK